MTDEKICQNCPYFMDNDTEGNIGCDGYMGDWAEPQLCLEQNPELAHQHCSPAGQKWQAEKTREDI